MEQEMIEAKKLGLEVVYRRDDQNGLGDNLADWHVPICPSSAQPPLEDLDSMKRVYVCTPFRGKNFSKEGLSEAEKRHILEENIRSAMWYCRTLARDPKLSVAPFAPHAFYPYFLPEVGRKIGWDDWFIASLEILKVCDAVYVYTNDGLPNKEFISTGMSHVIKLAEALGIEIQYKKTLPVPGEWNPAMPQFDLKRAISDLPKVAVPIEELKTVPAMGRRDDEGKALNNGATMNEEVMSQSPVDNPVEAPLEQASDASAGPKEQLPQTSIYFAAPLFTQAEWQWNQRLATELQTRGLNITLPQSSAYPMLKGEERFDAQNLFQSNLAALEATDIVLAVLDQADPDSGTSWECGYAFKAGRPIIGLRTDIRGGGDTPEGSVNLMLLRSCKEFINVPLSKRDDVEWIASEVINAIARIRSTAG
jgi:nucleoside 2-deoxyribosyltransferase